jgi:hypothetical protein
MKNEPKISLCHLTQEVNFSVETYHTISKELFLYLYRTSSVVELLPGDPAKRLQFWFSNTLHCMISSTA